MAKQCKRDKCSNPIFSNGYCRSHQYLRPDYKAYKYVRKPTGELDLFREIWNTRQRVSFLSGLPIRFFDVKNFAHVLPKGQNKFPKYKLKKENIILLTDMEHHLLDHGTIDERTEYEKYHNCSFNTIQILYEKLKLEYESEA